MTIIPEDLSIHKPDNNLIQKMEENELEENVIAGIDSDFHTISIVQNSIGRFLKYNDTYQAGFIDCKFYKGNLPYINYFLIPYLMNPDIKNILFIGLGSGIIINQYEKIFDLNKIDIVDIEENIFEIAQKHFDFKLSEKMSFYLQDALIYLKTIKEKYDLIVVDVAGDEGIDERFCEQEYLNLVKKCLKKDGIFVSNMPSSRDIFNKKNKFALELINLYCKNFEFVDIYNGETSNKIYYKAFFNIDEIVFDVTNLILISSNKEYKKEYREELDKIIDIKPFLKDLIKS